MARTPIDMIGYKTEHARVIARAAKGESRGHARWVLLCVCGSTFERAGKDIRRKPKTSCGCRRTVAPAIKTIQTPALCRCCERVADSGCRGLCRLCYGRAIARNMVDEVALPAKPNGFVGVIGAAHPKFKDAQTEEERGYQRMHRRLSSALGRAPGHMCAEGCGSQAAHHSYDGYCPEEKFGNATGDAKPWCPHERHYQPRCGSCHKDWDRDQDYVALEVA